MKIHKAYLFPKNLIYKSRSVGWTTGVFGDYSFMLKFLSKKNYLSHNIGGNMQCLDCGMIFYGTIHYIFDKNCGGWKVDDMSEIKVEEDLSCVESMVKSIIK